MSLSSIVALGLAFSGVSVGLMLSYLLIYNQAFLRNGGKTNLDMLQRLDVWARGYEHGKFTNAPFAAGTAIAFLSTHFFKNRLNVSEQRINLCALAGVASLLIVVVIKPVNDRLYGHLDVATNDKASVKVDEVERLLATWQTLHNVRVALSLVSLAMGFYATFGV